MKTLLLLVALLFAECHTQFLIREYESNPISHSYIIINRTPYYFWNQCPYYTHTPTRYNYIIPKKENRKNYNIRNGSNRAR